MIPTSSSQPYASLTVVPPAPLSLCRSVSVSRCSTIALGVLRRCAALLQVMTCANYIKLPKYTSAAVLKTQLLKVHTAPLARTLVYARTRLADGQLRFCVACRQLRRAKGASICLEAGLGWRAGPFYTFE